MTTNIRFGERVLILNPHVVIRVGYDGKRTNGSLRKVFTELRPVLAGQVGIVTAVTRIKTGIFRQGKTIGISEDSTLPVRSWLENEKVHRILTVTFYNKKDSIGFIKIEDDNVERDVPEVLRSIWEGIPARG